MRGANFFAQKMSFFSFGDQVNDLAVIQSSNTIPTIIRGGDTHLQCKKLQINANCPHKSSPVYGCDRCPVPPMNFYNTTTSSSTSSNNRFVQWWLWSWFWWWQKKRDSIGNAISPPLAHATTAAMSNEISQQPEYTYHISVRLKDGYRVSHDRVTARAFWWGYTVYFPRPTLERLNKAGNMAIALTGMLGSVSGTMVPLLLPILSSLASYLVFEGSFIRGVDRGYGVSISASWAVPVVFWPRPMPAPEVYIIYDPTATQTPINSDRISKCVDADCNNDGGLFDRIITRPRRRRLQRNRTQHGWMERIKRQMVRTASSLLLSIRRFRPIHALFNAIKHPIGIFALTYWGTSLLLSRYSQLVCFN